MKVVIIGGVAGGATAAARVRRLDESAKIVMFEKGEHISYANCGLPYYIGGLIAGENQLLINTPHSFKQRYNVDIRILSEVTAIDRKSKEVEVFDKATGKSYRESYDKLLISTGAEPIVPEGLGAAGERVFTLKSYEDALKIKRFIGEKSPKSAAVIGGGFIGMEAAENLHNLGIKVAIVEYSDHLLPTLDFDMACEFHSYLRKSGIGLHLNQKAERFEPTENGVKVTTSNLALEADMAILALGVRADSKLAKDAGLALTERGEIITDERMRTSDEDIFAVGDAVAVTEIVSGKRRHIPLAGPANKQARVAADNICGIESRYAGAQGTSIVKFSGIVAASTGLTENLARFYGYDYEKNFTYSPSHATYYPGAAYMCIKLVFEKGSGKVLGAQIVGSEGADKRIDVLAAAIRAGMTVRELSEIDLAYAPPFSSVRDPVNIAGYAASNILNGLLKVAHWHELDKMKDVQLIDVRNPGEYARGTIPGFINIPLDSIRENLDKIDKSRPVCVTCQIGLRGYVACRILASYGYDCYNLSGGYRLYRAIAENGKT